MLKSVPALGRNPDEQIQTVPHLSCSLNIRPANSAVLATEDNTTEMPCTLRPLASPGRSLFRPHHHRRSRLPRLCCPGRAPELCAPVHRTPPERPETSRWQTLPPL